MSTWLFGQSGSGGVADPLGSYLLANGLVYDFGTRKPGFTLPARGSTQAGLLANTVAGSTMVIEAPSSNWGVSETPEYEGIQGGRLVKMTATSIYASVMTPWFTGSGAHSWIITFGANTSASKFPLSYGNNSGVNGQGFQTNFGATSFQLQNQSNGSITLTTPDSTNKMITAACSISGGVATLVVLVGESASPVTGTANWTPAIIGTDSVRLGSFFGVFGTPAGLYNAALRLLNVALPVQTLIDCCLFQQAMYHKA